MALFNWVRPEERKTSKIITDAVGDRFDPRAILRAQEEAVPRYLNDIDQGGPRIIATDRQAPRFYPRMIRLCSRFDSVLFTPKVSEISSYGNYSRSPLVIASSVARWTASAWSIGMDTNSYRITAAAKCCAR